MLALITTFVFLFTIKVRSIDHQLYQINGRHCFHYLILDEKSLSYWDQFDFDKAYLLIPYCIPALPEIQGKIIEEISFDNLNQSNVSPDDLLKHSAPVDLVENYQEYLQTGNRNLTWKNCSTHWLGPNCEYYLNEDHSFSDLLTGMWIQRKKTTDTNIKQQWSYYPHLPCTRNSKPIFLDWREICDGQIQCDDTGADELFCFQLEMNECRDDEYRCYNGQCIPRLFLNDNPYNPDCLDGTDEDEHDDPEFRIVREGECYRDPNFRCEETAFYHHTARFSCGDGQYFLQIRSRDRGCKTDRDYFSFNYYTSRCSIVLSCLTYKALSKNCLNLCDLDKPSCRISLSKTCGSERDTLLFPLIFTLPRHVQLGYWNNQTLLFGSRQTELPNRVIANFTCYNQTICPHLPMQFTIDQLACFNNTDTYFTDLFAMFHTCLSTDPSYSFEICSHPSLFICPNTTKCISKHRLLDGIIDCPDGSDEVYRESNLVKLTDRFVCPTDEKYLARVLLHDGISQCLHGEDELSYVRQRWSYAKLCNGNVYHKENGNETDETDCHQWPCNNLYTRCNGMWNCLNGADELDCDPNIPCFPGNFECVSPRNYSTICLPQNRTNDGHMDCLGGMDERTFCRLSSQKARDNRYRCWNESKCVSIFFPEEDTDHCRFDRIEMFSSDRSKAILEVFAKDFLMEEQELTRHAFFQLHTSVYYSYDIVTVTVSSHIGTTVKPMITMDDDRAWYCQRGVMIHRGHERTKVCLCPPAYEGNRCQIQRDRVSLTLGVTKECTGSCHGVYILVMMLIENQSILHSFEQLTYISTIQCDLKYNFYLPYRTARKDLTKNFSIRIDAYDKMDLSYWTSWSYPVQHLFLPVNRLSVHLVIPVEPIRRLPPYQPQANNSYCYTLDNQSICVCPITRIGPRCLLDSICRHNPCQHEGICIPTDHRISLTQFTCLCSIGYSGNICEIQDTRLDLSFLKISIPQLIFIHLITVHSSSEPLITTIAKKIPFDQHNVHVYTPMIFNLIFIQIDTKFYLLFSQINATRLNQVHLQIQPIDQCSLIIPSSNNRSLLYRAKFYSQICRERISTSCLYDNEAFLCLCDETRFANCFQFPFQKKSVCQQRTHCENGGQCLENLPRCPSATICICASCFYGSRCQFTTEGSEFSLEVILGYHIYPGKHLFHQSFAVKISLVLTLIMFIIGSITSLCSILVFRSKQTREVGSGWYLFVLSIDSLLCIVLFMIRFWILIFSHMSVITHRSALAINCVVMEFFLRVLPILADWFSACVAIERAYVVFIGVNFNCKQSQQLAHKVILAVIALTLGTLVHDPIHRRLIIDSEEKRTWCILNYSHAWKRYNSIINLGHFLLPFAINLISAFIIIVNIARRHSFLHRDQSSRQHLIAQFKEKKHLIVTPIILVLLTIPRLVISFLTGCMKSVRDPWLFLIGYFISFVPICLSAMIFILTSKVYQNELSKHRLFSSMTRYFILSKKSTNPR